MSRVISKNFCRKRLAVGLLSVVFAVQADAYVRGDDLSPASLRPSIVTRNVERSIERGLKFLARTQRANGSLSKGSHDSSSRQTYPTAITSLAGLCFLSSGSTTTRGPYARNVRAARDYLLDNCTGSGAAQAQGRYAGQAAGLIYNPRANERRPMYCHAFAMTFLAQVYPHETHRVKRQQIRKVLRAAVALAERAQTDEGGWGYTANYGQDEGTLVVTQLMGLRACRDVGIYVPKKIIDGGVAYIELSATPSGVVRYRPHDSKTRNGVTCAAVVALWNAGRYNDPLLMRISNYVNRNIEPRSSEYYWQSSHHAEYVLYFLSQSQHVLGGEKWPQYYGKVSSMLRIHQNSDGSWEGSDRGDVYGTTIALLVLQLPYERLTVYQR